MAAQNYDSQLLAGEPSPPSATRRAVGSAPAMENEMDGPLDPPSAAVMGSRHALRLRGVRDRPPSLPRA